MRTPEIASIARSVRLLPLPCLRICTEPFRSIPRARSTPQLFLAAALFTTIAGAAPLTGSTAAAATPPLRIGTVPDLTWGISRPEIDRTVALVREAGIRAVRLNASWAAMEPSGKGAYHADNLAGLDYAVRAARSAGLEVLMPIADAVPYWASADPAKTGGTTWNKRYRPTNGQDYGDFVHYIVSRYSAFQVKAYQLWNEPNHPHFWPSGIDAAEYVDVMLRPGSAAVRRADPTAKVVLGGLSKSDYRYLEQLYRSGAKSYFDVVSFHPYTGSTIPTACWNDAQTGRRSKDAFCAIEEMRATMLRNGDAHKDVWLTEFGWSTGTGRYMVTEQQQADFLRAALAKLKSYPYVTRAFYYDFRNVSWLRDDPRNLNANFGLLRTDFSRKPAFAVLREWAGGRAGRAGRGTVDPRAVTRTLARTVSGASPEKRQWRSPDLLARGWGRFARG